MSESRGSIEPYINLKEAAPLVGVHYRSLLRAVNDGSVRSRRLPKQRVHRVRLSELVEDIDSMTRGPKS